MPDQVFNFSAGPSILPRPVLERAQEELRSYNGIGMSVMEISHRSRHFERILADAGERLRELMSLPENYRVLFLQGGATLQFSMVPLNFLPAHGSADYIVTGYWGKKAVPEAERCGKINVIYSSEDDGFSRAPTEEELRFTPDAAYIHYTSNETIDGVEFKYELDGGTVPVVCDASSNILSRPIDIEKYSLIYAGAQKNIGPSGVTVVIIRDDMLDRVPSGGHSVLDYRHIVENASMANTPNTWGIYLAGLVFEWLKGEGGVSEMERRNIEKAATLYDAIDASDGYYQGNAERSSRSLMNVTFRLPSEELDEKFVSEAEAAGLDGLRGHRSVGGIRASIYNAFPKKGVECLTDFMKGFAQRNG